LGPGELVVAGAAVDHAGESTNAVAESIPDWVEGQKYVQVASEGVDVEVPHLFGTPFDTHLGSPWLDVRQNAIFLFFRLESRHITGVQYPVDIF
jgi:hypothetical protein